MNQRDEFSEQSKRTLSARVGSCCSNPECQAATSGPHDEPEKTVNLGVAAHITAASLGGPRYDKSLSSQQRGSLANAIWLCQNCAKLIDSDPEQFPVELLRGWRARAEQEADYRLGKTRAATIARPTTVTNLLSHIRVVHPLQRAQHFIGREETLKELQSWWNDEQGVRCWTLQGFGGCGKTALIERFVEWVKSTHANDPVFVWSFYDDESVDQMLAEVSSWSSIASGRRALVVLDGLERVQAPATDGGLRGSIPDKRLKVFLRSAATAGESYRVLLTSRYPVVELHSWRGSAYREDSLDHLTAEQSIALLRIIGVRGEDDMLRDIAEQCGFHALTLTVWGAYIRYYHRGVRPGQVSLALGAAGGVLPEAAMLTRCLEEHAVLLADNERNSMCRIALEVETRSADYSAIIVHKLHSLGLISLTETGTISVHPALRDFFVRIKGVPREKIREVVQERTLELEEQPGWDEGECARCGEMAMIENAYCETCGVSADVPGEPEALSHVDGHTIAIFADARGDSYELKCPECESTELSYEFGTFCSYCEWMGGKDD